MCFTIPTGMVCPLKSMGRLSKRTGLIGTLSKRPTERRKIVSRRSQVVGCVAVCFLSLLSAAPTSLAATKHFDFDIALASYKRNCVTKPILAVNGQYPGPTIHISEGDRVIVKVTNSANSNITIHWHGIRQWLSGWQDGAAYITQCPIQPGDYFIYDFVVSDQRGTTFWHAHVNWARATVHGAFVTESLTGHPFTMDKEFIVILGEWWNADIETIRQEGLVRGGQFPSADALTINGFPGSLSDCSESEGITQFDVEPGKNYLLRIINAALNSEMFFGIANHVLTVVEADSNYVKPFTVNSVVLAPGQTMNVLVTADQPAGSYYMVGKFHDPSLFPTSSESSDHVPTNSTTALFLYKDPAFLVNRFPFFPILPSSEDRHYVITFENSLKSKDPQRIQLGSNVRHLLYTIGLGTEACTVKEPCIEGHDSYRRLGAINNISFQLPPVAILQALYYNIPGVYSVGFPDTSPIPYNYTDPVSSPYSDQVAQIGTRVSSVEYGTTIQLVLQDVHSDGFFSHPFHMHGYFFYVLGSGFGNFNAQKDPMNFNYYDPPARFTTNVPLQGWVAIQFEANNPGAWVFHCHFEKHNSRGMEMVFIVKNGAGLNESLPKPPRLNEC